MSKRSHWYPEGTLAEPYLPQEISKAQEVFPAGVGGLMPPADQIPDEFCEYDRTEWNKIVSQWFFQGLSDKTEFVPQKGIDAEAAFRHLRTIQGSFEPKHEYKEAAVAYLMSLWFKKVKNWK